MKPELRRFYEKCARANRLTSHGRRVFRRELAAAYKQQYREVFNIVSRHQGKRLDEDVRNAIRADLAAHFDRQAPVENFVQSAERQADGSVRIALTPEAARLFGMTAAPL